MARGGSLAFCAGQVTCEGEESAQPSDVLRRHALPRGAQIDAARERLALEPLELGEEQVDLRVGRIGIWARAGLHGWRGGRYTGGILR
jgi:hypothetical protein